MKSFAKPEQPLPFNSSNSATPDEWKGRRTLKDAFLIELVRIQPDPTQPRRNLDEVMLDELAESIRVLGVMQPILVRYRADLKIYQIISGERRFQAALRAGLTEIPCCVQNPEDRQILVRQVVENWQRADLHPFEIADSLGALREEWSYSQSDIAKLIGKSEQEVSKFLTLLTLTPSVQEEFRHDRSGFLSRSHMEEIARAPVEKQVALLQEVTSNRLNARETRKLVDRSVPKLAGQLKRDKGAGKMFRYATPKATVTVQFRRQIVSPTEVLEALDAARRRVSEQAASESSQIEGIN